MEFWGVEVKPGQSLVVKPGVNKYLHLSQATLGEIKKDKSNQNVTIFLKIGDQKLVLGILSGEKFPQLSFDLVFEKEFEISHNGKGGSVYCAGYQAFADDQEQSDDYLDSDSGSEDEELVLPPSENGKPQKEKSISDKSNAAKAASVKKSDVKPLEPSKDGDDIESDEDDDSDEEFDEEMLEADSDDSDDLDDSDDDTESDEETPKKVEQPKKRSNESASKTTPVPAKKAKLVSPAKTDGKKAGHPATPHPAKKSGKTPAKSVSPKSVGNISCKSCEKTFNSDGALQSHSKAKHGGK